MGNQSVRVSSRPTKSLKEWGVSRTTGTGVSSRFCRILLSLSNYLCRKDSHDSCSRNYNFLREGRVIRRALGTRAEACAARSDVRTAGAWKEIKLTKAVAITPA